MLGPHAAHAAPAASPPARPARSLPAGFLAGKKATAHPAFSDKLADQSVVPHRVVVDGGPYTNTYCTAPPYLLATNTYCTAPPYLLATNTYSSLAVLRRTHLRSMLSS